MNLDVYENTASSLIDKSWLLKLPFGENGVGVQYGIYSGDKRICPFCYKEMSFDEKGFPVCCKKYNDFRSQIESLTNECRIIENKVFELNSKIETEAKLDIKQYQLQLAKEYKRCFEDLIKNLEEQIDCEKLDVRT